MDIGWWRDLVIIIGGVIAIFIGLVVLLLVISIYRKTDEIFNKTKIALDSLQKAAFNVESFTQLASQELIKPVIEIVALFQGIKAGFGGLFKGRKDNVQ